MGPVPSVVQSVTHSRTGGTVIVVLAVHNGARFVADQIASIRAQTWRDWLLLVRDDDSRDDSRAIVQSLAERDDRIVLLPPDGRRRGVAGSFATLLREALDRGAAYLFIADHDDLWLPGKIERSLKVMQGHEAAGSRSRPALVHSDLRVVGEDLEPIHPSYRSYQAVSYDPRQPLRTLLLHNAATGCTFACNRSLVEFALPVPAGAMHDWWIAQCAATAGDILYISDPLVLYRQHRANVVGSPGPRALFNRLLARPWYMVPALLAQFRAGVQQAIALGVRVRERERLVPPERASIVREYAAAFATANPLRRLAAVLRSGVRPRRLVSHGFFYALVLIQPVAGRQRDEGFGRQP